MFTLFLFLLIFCRVPINLAVLSLIESGELTELFNKWWFENTDCDPTEKQETARNELSLKNVAGIFFILIGGLILSLIVALFEFFFNKRDERFVQQHHQNHQNHRHHQHHHQHQQQQQQQLQHPQQQQQQQSQQQHNIISGTETLKSKLTIPAGCEYDNGTVGVSLICAFN